MSNNEHAFAPYIRALGKGKTSSRSLNQGEAREAMGMILRGEVEPAQIGAFLMLLRIKEESAEEIAGFVEACRKHINKRSRPMPAPHLDWASYSGKRREHNWYLLAALLLAQHGYRVLMHGSAGHTEGRLYSEVALAALGIGAASDWEHCEKQLDVSGFSYFPLGVFCPELQNLIDLRSRFGLRSPVHTLTRLLNPASASASIQSVFHPSYSATHHQAAELLGEPRACVLKGEAGEVEYRPNANVRVLQRADGNAVELTFGRQWEQAHEPRTPDTQALIDTWRGEKEDRYGVEAIVGTTAIALLTMNITDTAASSVKKARELWEGRNRTQWHADQAN